jgi:cell division protease FtsH
MDGFGSHEGIIVIAATNRPDILDPALLRPGRFDRRVTVNYPDIKGREEILHVHARKKPLEADVDFHKIAQTTVGFTGADLANLLNEAALLAAKRGKSLIGMDEIDDSFMKLILGPQKKARVRNEHDNKLTAYHEAGHAVSSYYCEHTDPVKVITIIPAGNAGGVTVSVPTEDSMCHSKNEMFESIVWALGGRVAEELVMEDISTGASSDIQHATATARNMITRYGMSDKLGTVLYGSEHSSDEVFLGRDFSSGKNYSEKTAAEIDDEIRSLIDKAYKKCREILVAHKDKLEFVAQYLLARETMDGDQFKAAMEGEVTFEELDAMVEEKKRKSEEENRKRAEKLREEEKLRRIDEENNTDDDDSKDDDEPPFNRYAK